MQEIPLRAVSLAAALKSVTGLNVAAVRLYVEAEEVSGEVWLADSKLVVFAQCNPGDLHGTPALMRLLLANNARFVLYTAESIADVPSQPLNIEIEELLAVMAEQVKPSTLGSMHRVDITVQEQDLLKQLQLLTENAAATPLPANFELPAQEPTTSHTRLRTSGDWIKEHEKKSFDNNEIEKEPSVATENAHDNAEADSPAPAKVGGRRISAMAALTAVAISLVTYVSMANESQAKKIAEEDTERANRFAKKIVLSRTEQSTAQTFDLPQAGPMNNTPPQASSYVEAVPWPKAYTTVELTAVRQILREGNMLAAKGKHEAALRLLLKGLKKYPTCAKLRLAAIKAFLACGGRSEAYTLCLEGLDTAGTPDEAELFRETIRSIDHSR